MWDEGTSPAPLGGSCRGRRDACGLQLGQRRAAGVAGGHSRAHRPHQRGVEPRARGVERGRPDAVVGGEAADVDVGHLTRAQPVRQAGAVHRPPLEAGVGRCVLALEEDRVERLRVQVGMERLAVGADHTVRRPAVDEIGVVGEMVARVDVVVPGGDHDVVRRGLGVLPRPVVQQLADPVRHCCATRDGEASPFAEVVLHVDDDQRTLHPTHASGAGSGRERSRPEGRSRSLPSRAQLAGAAADRREPRMASRGFEEETCTYRPACVRGYGEARSSSRSRPWPSSPPPCRYARGWTPPFGHGPRRPAPRLRPLQPRVPRGGPGPAAQSGSGVASRTARLAASSRSASCSPPSATATTRSCLAELPEIPYPSPADALWLSWYPLSYVSIVLVLTARVGRFPFSVWLDGLVAGAGAAAVAAALWFEPLTATVPRDAAGHGRGEHGLPGLRPAAAVLLVGVAYMVRLAAQGWLMLLGVGFVATGVRRRDLRDPGGRRRVRRGWLGRPDLAGRSCSSARRACRRRRVEQVDALSLRRPRSGGSLRVMAVPLASAAASLALLQLGQGDRFPPVSRCLRRAVHPRRRSARDADLPRPRPAG